MPHDIVAASPADASALAGIGFAASVPRLTHVGPYRIVRQLGEGGMGVVYLAEQDEPVRRQVALKVLRAGLNTDEIVARFRSEQQTLAIMEHPNITRVYDAGTTESGLLYFVMEYVVGETITDYALSRRPTIPQRLELFKQVCRAVQHAHQKGMIHRDIKPSNVIVTETDGEATCKVIDFGIAKAVAPTPGSTRITMTGMTLGTPAYMSPEQFLSDGMDVDTRADIYALGVMLYELLAGVLPFDHGAHPSWAAVIAQHVGKDPQPPSTRYWALPEAERAKIASERRTDPAALRHTLVGDLDCVILTALERDRERRYATALALEADLERYLHNKPVHARTPSVAYRASKFIRRHRVTVAFTAALFVLLMVVAVGATVQARRLARARAVAVARQAQAEELMGFMLGDLRDKLTALGRLDLLDAVGDRALEYFAAVPTSQLSNEERFRRAQALQQLGEVRMEQGKLPAAADLMRQSLAIATGLAAHDSLNGRWQIGLAHSHFWAGNVDWQLGNVDAALGHFLPFVVISRRLIAHYPDSLGYREELVFALNNIGFAKEAKGDVTGALASYRAGREINEELLRRRPDSLDWQLSLANLHNAAAVAQRKLGDLPGALADHDQELALKRAVLARDTTNRERQRYVGVAYAYRGELHLLMGDVRDALADATAARSIYATLVAHDTSNASLTWSLAKSDRQVAQARLEDGDAAGALADARAGEALTTALLAKNSANPQAAAESIRGATVEARALFALGRAREALEPARRSAAAGDVSVHAKLADIERRRAAGDAYLALGDALAQTGDAAGARTAWQHALSLVEAAPGRDRQTEVLAVQGAALLALGRPGDAVPVIAELDRRGYRPPSFVKLVRDRSRRAA